MKLIETDRLVVRTFKPEDWRDLQEYISTEEVLRFERPWDSSDESLQKNTAFFGSIDYFWAVELKESGKMIGHLYFNQTKPEEFRTWILGYIFNPQYYGRGYATEACRGILQYGFDHLHIHRVIAKCSPDNIKSWRLLERLSMRREGHGLKCVTLKSTPEGAPIWWDEYQYALLAEEWVNIDKS